MEWTACGRTFKTEAEAVRYETMMKAKDAYETARSQYVKALTETCKTADGYDFELNGMATYYYVREPFFSAPVIGEVGFYLWHCSINEEVEASIRQRDEQGDWHTYLIADLYRFKENARKRQIHAYKEFMDSLQKTLEALESSVDA